MKLRTKTRSLRVLSAILAMSLAIGTTGWMPIAAENEDVQAEAFAGRELWAPETEEEAAPPNTEGDLSPAQLQTAQLSPEEIPEAVSKEDIAERGHVHRLWKQEEDENSIVFQNRDGTKTLYYFTEAVKYVDENGAVQDKSNTLQDIGSASSASGYRYVNGYNDIKTYFPAQLGSGTGLLLKHGDIQIELTPAYAQRGETAEAGGPAEEVPADPEEAESADVPEDTAVSEDTAAEAGEAAGTTPTSSAVPFEAADDAAALAFPEENSAAASTPASDPSPVLPSPTAMESEGTAPTGPSGTMPGTTEAGTAAADNTAAFPETTRPAEPTLPPVPEAAVDNAPILAKHSVPAEKKTADPDGHTADTVEYAEVFGEHTALRYTPTFSGFKEDIVLSENIGRNEFTFELQTGGLSLAQEGETVGLFDPLTGERVAMLDNILVFDSGGPAADEGEEIVPRHHYYRVETVEPDALYRVTVVVDEAFLNDPGTVYPVVIDPAITLTGSSGGIEDATIYSNYLVNEGSSGSVFVGSYNARYGGTRGVARTLVRFPGLLNSTVYQSLDSDMISSVSLRIRDLMCESDAVKINAYRMTSGWTEDTVKCSGAIWDSYNQAVLSSSTVQYGNGYDSAESSVTGGQWYRFDITSAVKGWKAGTYAHHGIMLRANSETNAAKTFASSDRSSYQPVVVMNYTSPTTTPPGVTNGGTYYIQNVCSGLYLNLQGNGTANNTPAIQSSLAYKTSQRFKLVRDSSGYYRIQAQNTTAKRVLLLNTSNQVVLSDDCSSSRALWRIKDEGGGQYSFINKATETYAMSNANNGTSGSAVKGEIYSSATQQKWKLNKAVTNISVTYSYLYVQKGKPQTITVTVNPSDAYFSNISLVSSNSVKIDNLGNRQYNITASSTGVFPLQISAGGIETQASIICDENSDWDIEYDLSYEANSLQDFYDIIIDDVSENTVDFVVGVAQSIANNKTFGFSDWVIDCVNDALNTSSPTSVAYYAGRCLGDLATAIQSFMDAAQAITQAGSALQAAAVAAGPSGGLSLLAGVAVVGSQLVVVAYDGTVLYISVTELLEHVNLLLNTAQEQSPYTRAPRRPSSSNPHYVGKVINPDGTTEYTMMDDNGVTYTVTYNKEGFPDFSDYAHPVKGERYEIQYSGNRITDINRANLKAGLDRTPDGYVWHHTEDGKMQLVNETVHNLFPHTGGFALYK